MKTTLSIIAAALVSGAAYGQSTYGYSPEVQAYGDRMRGDFRSTQILEQLEEIQAQQRQIKTEIFNRQLFQEQQCEPHHLNRWEREQYLRDYLEDCE